MIDFWSNMMAAYVEVMEIIEMTFEEAEHALTMGDAPEGIGIVADIPKSPRMVRPKKQKQEMVPLHESLQNLLRTRLTMEEKGKVINIETDEEEEDLKDLIIK